MHTVLNLRPRRATVVEQSFGVKDLPLDLFNDVCDLFSTMETTHTFSGVSRLVDIAKIALAIDCDKPCAPLDTVALIDCPAWFATRLVLSLVGAGIRPVFSFQVEEREVVFVEVY